MNREIKSKSELARILNISRQTLYNLIEEFEKTLETVDMTT